VRQKTWEKYIVLFENNILSELTHDAMIKMAKFRNLIVHDYAHINPQAIIGILKKKILD
jgi:uncharacterized protein YutE (UPF0331/DUF86 family)